MQSIPAWPVESISRYAVTAPIPSPASLRKLASSRLKRKIARILILRAPGPPRSPLYSGPLCAKTGRSPSALPPMLSRPHASIILQHLQPAALRPGNPGKSNQELKGKRRRNGRILIHAHNQLRVHIIPIQLSRRVQRSSQRLGRKPKPAPIPRSTIATYVHLRAFAHPRAYSASTSS